MDGLDSLVSEYRTRFGPCRRAERLWYLGQPSVEAAIFVAANSTTSKGKRHPHQRRIPGVSIRAAAEHLEANKDLLGACETFERLFSLVEELVGPIPKIGELYVYDVSLRLGWFLWIEPVFVYVRAGTRTGAKSLGFAKMAKIPLDSLPREIAQLGGAGAEDFLCVMKARLSG